MSIPPTPTPLTIHKPSKKPFPDGPFVSPSQPPSTAMPLVSPPPRPKPPPHLFRDLPGRSMAQPDHVKIKSTFHVHRIRIRMRFEHRRIRGRSPPGQPPSWVCLGSSRFLRPGGSIGGVSPRLRSLSINVEPEKRDAALWKKYAPFVPSCSALTMSCSTRVKSQVQTCCASVTIPGMGPFHEKALGKRKCRWIPDFTVRFWSCNAHPQSPNP